MPTRRCGDLLRARKVWKIGRPHYKPLIRCFLLVVVSFHIWFLWNLRGRAQKGDPDFTVYYTAARILREGHGHALYDSATQLAAQREFTANSDIRRGPLPYIHPPVEALIFWPLTFLPYFTALELWNALNLFLLIVIWLLLRRVLPSLQKIALGDWMLLSLAFFPVLADFHQGQDAIFLLLLFVLGFRALDLDSDFAAGCWFGLGVFKYHFVIPLFLILGLWKGRRLILGFCTTAFSMALISLAIVGWRGALQYPAYAWRVVSIPSLGGLPPRLTPNLLGLLAAVPFFHHGWPLRSATMIASLGLLLAVALMGKGTGDRQRSRLSFAAAVIASLLAGYSTNTYDLSLLLLPLAIIAEDCLNNSTAKFMLLPALPLLVSPLWFVLWLHWWRTNLMAVFLLWWIYAIWRELRTAKPRPVFATGAVIS